MSLLKVLVIFGLGLTSFSCGLGVEETQTSEPVTYIVSPEKISLHWKDADGKKYKQLEQVRTVLEEDGKQLELLMNAGIYEEGEIPSGLHIENGNTLNQVNTKDGKGNFYTKPNGIFHITDKDAQISETNDYIKLDLEPDLAIQSGPLLMQDGKAIPGIEQSTKSKFTRNGIGVRADGQVIIIYSPKEISLAELTNLFKQAGAESALYLDGFVSKTVEPEPRTRIEAHTDFASIIAVEQ